MTDQTTLSDKQGLSRVIRYRVGARIQKDVAEKGGLDPTTMSQFASGNRYPRSHNMAKLAKALDCSVPEIKGAVATVQAVADSGGGKEQQIQALDLYFMGVKGDSDAAKVARMEDQKLQSLLKNVLRSTSELISYITANRHRDE